MLSSALLVFIKYLLCAIHCAKLGHYIISFKSQCNSVWWAQLPSLNTGEKNRGLEGCWNLLLVTQLTKLVLYLSSDSRVPFLAHYSLLKWALITALL